MHWWVQNCEMQSAMQSTTHTALLLLLGLRVCESSYVHSALPTRHRGTSHSRVVHAVRMEDEAARRERLAQLFGEDSAGKIAEHTTSTSGGGTKAEEPVPEIQMLVEGMQLLEWGQIRLIDVDMAPGPLELSVAPLLNASSLLCVRLDMPLGMLLEEEETGALSGAMVVGECLEEGSAQAGGVREGDVLRATTACSMQMSYPTWQLMMGGVGQPRLQKILFAAQDEPFEKVMAAIASNMREQQGNGQVVLLLERPSDAAPAAAPPAAAEE